jgi:integrase/recombinase XerD
MVEIRMTLMDSPSRRRKDGSYPVMMQVTYAGERRFYNPRLKCKPEDWIRDGGRFSKSYRSHKQGNLTLTEWESAANRIVSDFIRDQQPFSFDKFDELFRSKPRTTGLEEYFALWIKRFRDEGREENARIYQTAANRLVPFLAELKRVRPQNVRFEHADEPALVAFIHQLRANGLKDTSIHAYLRTYRALLYKGVRDKLIKRDQNPFLDFKLSEHLSTSTQKRAIDQKWIVEISQLDLTDRNDLQFARDIFLFSYYTRGMNFIDMIKLKWADVVDGRIRYRRSKTKKYFNIRILPPVEQILDKYYAQGREYVFPVLKSGVPLSSGQISNRKKSVLKDVNRGLKEIAKIVGMGNFPLTTYVSRYSYANTLKRGGVSINHIGEALGHSSEEVTRIYLNDLENHELDTIDQQIFEAML